MKIKKESEELKKQKFVTPKLCLLLVLYVTSIFTALPIAYAAPNITICKRFLETSDPSPYEMRTLYHWDIQIQVSTDVALTDANVYDRFGGELKIDHITVPGGPTYTFTYPNYPENYITKDATVTISEGVGNVDLDKDEISFGNGQYSFFIYWSGKTHKIHFQWIIGNLGPGEISVIIGVSTDFNPGGQPEFTSPCEHVLNSGATLHARCRGRRISAYSESLLVKVECAARLLIDKFDDVNSNGMLDVGEPKIPGWRVDVTDPYGVVMTHYTPVDLEINDYGAYIITEEVRVDWTQTAVFVDGAPQTVDPTVTVTANLGETHEVLYGNTYCPPPGRLVIKKFNDKNSNGVFDGTDVWLTSWTIDITDPSGDLTTYTAVPIDLVITEFGTYTITEDIPLGWVQTARIVDGVPQTVDPTATVSVNAGESHEVVFGNYQPPPPPIGVSLSINPIVRPVGGNIAFAYTITSPPEVTSVSVVLTLTPPSGTPFDLYTGITFPADFARTETWTATAPTGIWWIRVTYTYTYLGLTYTAGTLGSFQVTTTP